jgi:hypothetical protein
VLAQLRESFTLLWAPERCVFDMDRQHSGNG